MPAPYSADLRSRVIDLLNQNKTQMFISNLLNISTKTIQRWMKLYNDTGNLSPKKPTSTRPRRVAYEKIIEYIDQNPGLTQDEIGSIFGIQDVWYVIKKMNYTYKKTFLVRGEKGRFEKRVQRKDQSNPN